jgi:hypothetical protein
MPSIPHMSYITTIPQTICKPISELWSSPEPEPQPINKWWPKWWSRKPEPEPIPQTFTQNLLSFCPKGIEIKFFASLSIEIIFKTFY